MIGFTLLMAAMGLVATAAAYLLIATGVVYGDGLQRLYERLKAAAAAGVLAIARLPLWLHVLIVTGVALVHQAALLGAPRGAVLLTMSSAADAALLKSGVAKQADDAMLFVRRRRWLRLLSIPVALGVVAAAFVVTAGMYVLRDPHASACVLWTLCVPLGLAMALWELEARALPQGFRRDWLGTVGGAGRDGPRGTAERPTAGARRKVLLVSLAVVCVLGLLVAALEVASSGSMSLLRVMLGRTLDPRLYLAGVTAAVGVAGAVATLQLDGQTHAAGSKDDGYAYAEWWTADAVKTHYFHLLVVMCAVALVAFVAFPLFNTPFFAARRLATAAH